MGSAPHDARRLFLQELLGDQSINPIPSSHNGHSTRPISRLAPLVKGGDGIQIKPQLKHTAPPQLHSSIASLKTSTNGCPPNPAEDPRRRRYTGKGIIPLSTNRQSDPHTNGIHCNNPTTTTATDPTPSCLERNGSVSTLHGAGGGRRIFKRVGMQTMYDTPEEETTTTRPNGTSPPDPNHTPPFPNQNEVPKPAAFVRARHRQQTPSILSPSRSFGGAIPTLRQSSPNPSLNEAPAKPHTHLGKERRRGFTGTHRRRWNCPMHPGINAGDVHVLELTIPDASHYLRPYPLTASPNPMHEKETNDTSVLDSILSSSHVGNNGGMRRKTSAELTRTLSNMRAESKAHSASLTQTNALSTLRENVHDSARVIHTPWSADPDGSSASDSASESCCSCCSCFMENGWSAGRGEEGVARNGTATHCTPTEEYAVVHNNFLEDNDIPTLSMRSFRRSSRRGGERHEGRT